jgi:hypothetical protein
LILDFEFDQHLESHKHVINIIMGFRDMGCYTGRERRGAGAADRWGRAAMGPDGQRRGVGESERERGSTARGTARRARQHSDGRLSFKLDFKPIQTYSNGSKEI